MLAVKNTLILLVTKFCQRENQPRLNWFWLLSSTGFWQLSNKRVVTDLGADFASTSPFGPFLASFEETKQNHSSSPQPIWYVIKDVCLAVLPVLKQEWAAVKKGKVLKTSEVIALGMGHGKDFKIQVPQSKRQRDIFVRQCPDQGFSQLLLHS